MTIQESFYAFIDTETTGLIAGKDQITEIATVLTDMDLNEIANIEMKARVTVPVPADVAKINGYDQAVWDAEARPFDDWMRWLSIHVPFGHVAVPVGHNIDFDDSMIRRGYYLPKAKFCPLAYNKIDTRALADVISKYSIGKTEMEWFKAQIQIENKKYSDRRAEVRRKIEERKKRRMDAERGRQ